MISEAEKQHRHQAVANSEGSLAMEGLRLDPQMAELSRRYSEGEIDLEEFGRLTDEHLAYLAAAVKTDELTFAA